MPSEFKFNPLDHPVGMLEPLRVTQESAFVEQIPLAFLLIDLARPNLVVELGVHFGDSYCAFCQAVARLGLPTKLVGVDRWSGDAHTGGYGPEVLALLRRHHDPLYAGFSKLMPMEFDSALSQFAEGEIDLLHIDGLHTYEAVRHDFESWLPKMSAAGVVLFHDTQDRTGDFGVYKLWAELAATYPHFEFTHGPGLGVLAVGKEVPVKLARLLDASPTEADGIRLFYARLGREIGLRRFLTQLMRNVFKAQSAINAWKQNTGQVPTATSMDIRTAMNQSLSFAQLLVGEVEALAQSELNQRRKS